MKEAENKVPVNGEALNDEQLNSVNGGAWVSSDRAKKGYGRVSGLVQNGQNSATLENLLYQNLPGNGTDPLTNGSNRNTFNGDTMST